MLQANKPSCLGLLALLQDWLGERRVGNTESRRRVIIPSAPNGQGYSSDSAKLERRLGTS